MGSFTAQEGLPMATKVAHDSIGTDATLISVTANAVPNVPTWPGIDFTTGKAGYWTYTFVSPTSGLRSTVTATKSGSVILAMTGQTEDAGNVQARALDFNEEYATMAKLRDLLGVDTTFVRFRSTNADMVTMVVQLGPPTLSASLLSMLPPSFPKDRQVWQAVFTASAMEPEPNLTCIVVSSTGETFCAEDNVTIASVDAEHAAGAGRLTASPNPASGIVAIYLPEHIGGTASSVHMELFDALGNSVRDLGALPRNSTAPVAVDTHDLADGLYICRATAGDWSSSMGIVVRH
jgi:hypothetical protein